MLSLLSIGYLTLIMLWLRASKWHKDLHLNSWILPSVYLLKCAVGFIFLQFYLFQSPTPQLENDAGYFLFESGILNRVFYESPENYFKLLTGIGETEQMVQQYLHETDHWSSGSQSIINDNKNTIRLHSLIRFFSGGSPWIHLFTFCFFSLIGTTLLYRWANQFSSLPNHFLFIGLFILPSTLFWSSSVIKEPLLILALGCLLSTFYTPLKSSSKIIFAISGSAILLAFKSYIFMSILPAMLFYGLYRLFSKSKYTIIISLTTLALVGILPIFAFRSEIDDAIHQLARKQFDFSNVGRGGTHVLGDTCFYYFTPNQYDALLFESDSVELKQFTNAWIVRHGSIDKPIPIQLSPTGKKWRIHFKNPRASSFIEIPEIRTIKDLITSSPNALVNALFRPIPTDPGSFLKYPVFLETMLIFLFLLTAFSRRRKLNSTQIGVLLSLLIFILTLSLLIGWVTPVLGAIARYRIPIHLAIIICGSILLKFDSKPKAQIRH